MQVGTEGVEVAIADFVCFHAPHRSRRSETPASSRLRAIRNKNGLAISPKTLYNTRRSGIWSFPFAA